MDLTRRSFLAGLGGVSVGLLFHRQLEAALDFLERELVAEPVAAGQLPAAAEIVVSPMAAFRPERLVISGVVTSMETVAETEFRWCASCDGGGWFENGDACETCHGDGGESVATGRMVEREVRSAPWIIEDITIGERSQFAGSGGLAADFFTATSPDAAVMMDAAQPGAEIRFRVRYTGSKPEGEVFRAALIGRGLNSAGASCMAVLPIDSGCVIAA